MEKRKKKTIYDFQEMKKDGKKITYLTCYTYPFAQFCEEAGLNMLLVGDSLRMCVYGYPNTIKRIYTKIDPMNLQLVHTEAVTRGAPSAFVIGDMPFGSYQESTEKAIHNARRFFEEAGVDAIKLEGGTLILDKVKGIVDSGMAIMGHIGLTPQTSNINRKSKVHGKTAELAKSLIVDALALEEAGAFSILLEAIPPEVGLVITKLCKIPILGIGAGPYTDGQLLIIDDVIGMFKAFPIKFVKKYVDFGKEAVQAFEHYVIDVQTKRFPEEKHCYGMKEKEAIELVKELEGLPSSIPYERKEEAAKELKKKIISNMPLDKRLKDKVKKG